MEKRQEELILYLTMIMPEFIQYIYEHSDFDSSESDDVYRAYYSQPDCYDL